MRNKWITSSIVYHWLLFLEYEQSITDFRTVQHLQREMLCRAVGRCSTLVQESRWSMLWAYNTICNYEDLAMRRF